MATTMKRSHSRESQNSTESIGDRIYSAGRVGVRTAYTTLPMAVYGATSGKLNEIDNFNWLKKLLAYIFYRGDISRLNELNDHAAKASGAAGGLLVGYGIDKATEYLFPRNKSIRKVVQPLSYFGAANVANAVKNGFNGLENLVQDTVTRSIDTFSNIAQTGNASDSDYLVNTGIAALTGLAVVKGVNSILRSGIARESVNFVKDLAREFYGLGKFVGKNTIGKLYSLVLGDTNDRYEARRCSKVLRKRAKKLEDEADNVECYQQLRPWDKLVD